MLAGQVRQYSWHHYVKKENDIYDFRREFVGANRQTNCITPSLSQQAPLVSRSHLMAVVRKVERGERSKGKILQNSSFKGLHKSQEKNITSLLFSRQKPEGVSQHYSVIRDDDERNNSEMNQLVHTSQYANDKYPLKTTKAKKENEEVKIKRPEATNDDGIKCDVMNHDNDVTIRALDVNRLVARKRYAARKQSPIRSKGIFKRSLNACNRTFTKIALPLIMVLCILGGSFNIKRSERKSTIGTSPSLPLLEPLSFSASRAYWFLSNLREYTDADGDINRELWSRIPQMISLNNNEQLIRYIKILQNTIICICPSRSLFDRLKLAAPYVYHDYATYEMATFTRNVSAGNHFYPYISPSTDLCASRIDYFDTDTVNLESDYHFTAFYKLKIYIYIFTFYSSWSSCNSAIYSSVIFYTLVYFSSNWIMTIIKSHDEYQSFILIGLALTGKANSGIQNILFHFRSHWKGREAVQSFSCSAPAPRTRCLGDLVARFAKPFESRPTDPVRREIFRQLASSAGTSSSSGWVAPTALLSSTPRPLERATEGSSSRALPSKLNARRRLQF